MTKEKTAKAVAKPKTATHETLPDGRVVVTLGTPIVVGEEQIEKLTFKKPKAKHLKGVDMKKQDADSSLALMVNLTGQFPHELEELDMADFFYCLGVVESFLPDTALAGKTP